MTDESFTHGMLYGSPDCLTLLVREEHKTRNVVYSEVFIYVTTTHLLLLFLLVLWQENVVRNALLVNTY